ncbi:hypothetical protein [Robertmurraya kyonggiensis]|uniref:Uncharacterized protein n=1 Tax=Robertmurraya kyonggiensis TaxID=1037680 RepID=A0A4U1D7U8_9BACI|nr:hypothetical protein [Robertmurraya kyonggiensis]TKC18514.1 hypothetical protein FA727_02885 [Robertmurraya kyonggiensis]
MKQLMNSLTKKDPEKERKAMLRLEMDYELLTLFDAMADNNETQKVKSKAKLEKIRTELLKLRAL